MAAFRWCRVPTCVDVGREATLCTRGRGSPNRGVSIRDRAGAYGGIGGREPQVHSRLTQHAYMRRDQAHGGRGDRLRRRGIGIRRRGGGRMTVPPRLTGPPSLAGGAPMHALDYSRPCNLLWRLISRSATTKVAGRKADQ